MISRPKVSESKRSSLNDFLYETLPAFPISLTNLVSDYVDLQTHFNASKTMTPYLMERFLLEFKDPHSCAQFAFNDFSEEERLALFCNPQFPPLFTLFYVSPEEYLKVKTHHPIIEEIHHALIFGIIKEKLEKLGVSTITEELIEDPWMYCYNAGINTDARLHIGQLSRIFKLIPRPIPHLAGCYKTLSTVMFPAYSPQFITNLQTKYFYISINEPTYLNIRKAFSDLLKHKTHSIEGSGMNFAFLNVDLFDVREKLYMGAHLYRFNLPNTNLFKTKWNIGLSGNFSNSDLRMSTLSGALDDIDFRNADLRGAKIKEEGVYLKAVDFLNAKLDDDLKIKLMEKMKKISWIKSSFASYKSLPENWELFVHVVRLERAQNEKEFDALVSEIPQQWLTVSTKSLFGKHSQKPSPLQKAIDRLRAHFSVANRPRLSST